MSLSRRGFIRYIPAGLAGIAAGSQIKTHEAGAALPSSMKSRVSFAAGKDRRELIAEALKPFENEIRAGIKGKQVVIKPNCVWDGNPLCATDPDAIRAVLDFLKPIYDRQVIIGESTASPKGTMYTFEEYGYTPTAKEYNVKLVDLNLQPGVTEWILGENRIPIAIKIIDTFLAPDSYIISLARMKAHNCVLATLTLKNVIMASPLNLPAGHPDFVSNQYEKAKMHQGNIHGINYNIYLLTHKIRPQLAIIDGFVGMEGNGPTEGTPVEHGVALAGLDAVAVDRIGIELMGVRYADVGYLQWCSDAGLGQGNREKIEILGPDIERHIIPYRMHDNIEWQLKWKNDPKTVNG
ncbi:DUF362 domain-containing protein [bacterium]|nr:DUF362 domain-containing protein [bacterium]